MRPWLATRALAKRHGATTLFAAVDIALPRGATLAVIGASGVGKTSLLRVLAGLDQAHEGTVELDGVDVTGHAPRARGALYLYQEALLFPHLDVFDNLTFGLAMRARPAAEIARTVEAMLVELEIAHLARRAPHTLSGGERQRVAFGRALVVQPRLLLLDEPFGSLDPDTRASMQALWRRVAREHAITAVFVTHDLKEALSVGDYHARLAGGRLTVYADRAAFCADPASGVAQERAFWHGLGAE